MAGGQVRKSDILIVDDEREFGQMLAEHLASEHRACVCAGGGSEAYDLICRKHFDVVVSDISMPGITGLDLLDKVLAVQPQCQVILMTGRSSVDWAKQAIRHGAFEYVEKPFDLEELDATVTDALTHGTGANGEGDGRTGGVSSVVAQRDGLTGLLTHRRFFEELASMRSLCRRAGRSLTLVIFDLDNFGQINGRHGHATGDLVLLELAGKLRGLVRSTDVLARYGGEEFAVVMDNATSKVGRRLAQQVRDLLAAEPMVLPDGPEYLTVSAGIVESQPGFVESESELVNRAMQAVRVAKDDGRDRVVCWNSVDAVSPSTPAVDEGSLNQMMAEFGQINQHLRRAYLESTRALVAAVEAKEPFTERHSMVVALYAEELARQMCLPEEQVSHLCTAAMLHDIGKIGIPDSILTKPGRLTDSEFALIRQHPQMAVQILEHASFLRAEIPIILHHHERWDGEGYPDGLAGEAIPLAARILHVADSMDAMFSVRSYKQGYSREKVADELVRGKGSQFDPGVVEIALSWMDRYPDKIVTSEQAADAVVSAAC